MAELVASDTRALALAYLDALISVERQNNTAPDAIHSGISSWFGRNVTGRQFIAALEYARRRGGGRVMGETIQYPKHQFTPCRFCGKPVLLHDPRMPLTCYRCQVKLHEVQQCAEAREHRDGEGEGE